MQDGWTSEQATQVAADVATVKDSVASIDAKLDYVGSVYVSTVLIIFFLCCVAGWVIWARLPRWSAVGFAAWVILISPVRADTATLAVSGNSTVQNTWTRVVGPSSKWLDVALPNDDDASYLRPSGVGSGPWDQRFTVLQSDVNAAIPDGQIIDSVTVKLRLRDDSSNLDDAHVWADFKAPSDGSSHRGATVTVPYDGAWTDYSITMTEQLTGVPWTRDTLGSAEFGMGENDDSTGAWCTSVSVVVAYHPDPARNIGPIGPWNGLMIQRQGTNTIIRNYADSTYHEVCTYYQPIQETGDTGAPNHYFHYAPTGSALTGADAASRMPMGHVQYAPGTITVAGSSLYSPSTLGGALGVGVAGVAVDTDGSFRLCELWTPTQTPATIALQGYYGALPGVGRGTVTPRNQGPPSQEYPGYRLDTFTPGEVSVYIAGGEQWAHTSANLANITYISGTGGEFKWFTMSFVPGFGGDGGTTDNVDLTPLLNALDTVPDPDTVAEISPDWTLPDHVVENTIGTIIPHDQKLFTPTSGMDGVGEIPSWTFHIPLSTWTAGLGSVHLADFDLHTDFTPFYPWRTLFRNIWLAGWTIWGMGRVWQELRRQ